MATRDDVPGDPRAMARPLSVDRVREILKRDEARRRRAARKRMEEIEMLLAEQHRDSEGRLWGETSLESKARAWETTRHELVGRLCPYHVTPEVILLRREERGLIRVAVAGLPETCQEMVEGIQRGMTLRELARTFTHGALPEFVRLFLKIVQAVRPDEEWTASEFLNRLGVFPGEIEFEERDGRVHLSKDARALSGEQLQAALLVAGYEVSRPTAYRAKQSGHFCPDYHEGGVANRLGSGSLGWVKLTTAERGMTSATLSRKLGISRTTAGKAKERGWFSVMPNNREKLKLRASRIRSGEPPST